MKIFLSYDFKTQEKLAGELTSALAAHGYSVWQDQHRRRNLRRVIADWLQSGSESGLDAWLRQGVLESDIVVTLVPYDRPPDDLPLFMQEALERPSTPDELMAAIDKQLTGLFDAYQGRASDKWDDLHQVDRIAPYLLRPIQTRRMLYYQEHLGVPLGKDPYEHWRHFEMRLAGACELYVVCVVLIDAREERFAESIEQELAQYKFVVILRSSAIETDVRDRLLPAIRLAAPTEERARAIHERRRELRRLDLRAKVRVLIYAAIAVSILALLVLGIMTLL